MAPPGRSAGTGGEGTPRPGGEPNRWRPSPRAIFRSLGALAGVVGLIVVWQGIARTMAQYDLERATEANAIPVVMVAQPSLAPDFIDVNLPGTAKPLREVGIFARTNGFVRSWSADIGGRVTKGQVLVEIDTPEIDEQLRQSEADLATIQANAALAKATAERWRTLGQGGTVSRQAVEEKSADAAAKAAQVASAKANVERLTQLRKFRSVTAPFDGVITARKVDVGTLINAGSGTGGEMLRLADISALRVFVQVPQSTAPLIRPGLKAEIRNADHLARVHPAEVVRTAETIDPVTRMMLVELETANADSEILAGSYVEVRLRLPVTDRKLLLPVNALLFRAEGPVVAAVDDQGVVSIKPVTLGLDFGTQVEITGIAASDRVILNPVDSVADGRKVRVADRKTP